MKIIRWAGLTPALVGAALLAGCGMGDVYGPDRGGPYDHGRDPYYDNSAAGVQGTVERVDARDQTILVRQGEGSRSLRNDHYGDRASDRVLLHYDERTRVSYQGRTFDPADLEPGDEIRASVDETGRGLFVQDIQVVYDVSANGRDDRDGRGPYDQGPYDRGPYDGNPGSSRDRDPQYGGIHDRDGSSIATDVEGVVRSVDTRNHTLEIDTSAYGGSRRFNTDDDRRDVVTVRYNSSTVVSYQGQRYGAERLERGDAVRIETRRDPDGILLAQSIQVTGENQPVGR